jgi:predicted RNA-binding Zn ribbon-like protein
VNSTIGDVLPEEPAIVRFLNTIWADRDGAHDDLDSSIKAHLMLTRLGHGNLKSLTTDDAGQLRELRDALRRLTAHCTGDDRQRAESPLTLEASVTIVNRHAGRPIAGPTLVVDGDSTLEVSPAGRPTFEDLLTQVARDGVDAMTPPAPLPLRACRAPSCVLYYMQGHPRRGWCSAACGNRARAARHYARSKNR